MPINFAFCFRLTKQKKDEVRKLLQENEELKLKIKETKMKTEQVQAKIEKELTKVLIINKLGFIEILWFLSAGC